MITDLEFDHDHGILVAGTAGDLQYRVAKHATIHGMQILTAAAGGSLSGVLNPTTEAIMGPSSYAVEGQQSG